MKTRVPYAMYILTPPHNLHRRCKLDYSCQMFQRIGNQGFPCIRSGVGTNILADLADKGVVKYEGTNQSILGYVLPYVVEASSSKNLFPYVLTV